MKRDNGREIMGVRERAGERGKGERERERGKEH